MGEQDSRSEDRDQPQQSDDPIDGAGELEAELEQRDAAIAELQESLRVEQHVTRTLRENIKNLDDRIGSLGDGLIDRLGTCRDLQSVLADERARSEEVEGELEERNLRLSELNTQAEDRSRALSEYQEQLDELTQKRDELQVRLAASGNQGIESNALDQGVRRRSVKPERELYSLEELMAETTVLTEEDVAREESRLYDIERAPVAEDFLADMVSPDLIAPNAVGHNPNGGALGNSADPSTARLGTLVVSLQGRHQVKYPLFSGEITIGRSKTNDIQINSEFVSRAHARILMTDQEIVIEDVSSKNGIVVGATSVSRHVFNDGDTVTLGTTHITFFTSHHVET